MEKRIWNAEEIRDLIQTNDKVLYGAMMKLYEQQTDSEKCDRSTHEQNGRGFNKFDAEIMTAFVEFFKRRHYLTDRQKEVARRKMVKYTKQLVALQ